MHKISLQTHIGFQIRQARRSAERTQDDVAAALGLSTEDLNQIERGQYVLTSKILAEVANELSVDVLTFYRDVVTDEALPSLADGLGVQQEKALIINRVQLMSDVKSLRLISSFLDTLD